MIAPHHLLCALLIATTFVRAQTPVLEPWTDPNLPVREGLVAWFDGSREPNAQAAAGLAADRNTVIPGHWHDVSGHRRHARQVEPAKHPGWRYAFPNRYFTFDGRSQSFTVDTRGLPAEALTLVVYARVAAKPTAARTVVALEGSGRDAADALRLEVIPDETARDGFRLRWRGAGVVAESRRPGRILDVGPAFAATATLDVREASLSVHDEREILRREPTATATFDRLLIGAPPDRDGAAAGFFHGDVFELLVFDRALNADEVKRLGWYFDAKYASLVAIASAEPTPAAPGSVPLEAVSNPPVIQPLVPGFVARRLPVALTNINFLRYRPDGRLYAGAYNGKVHVLRDTDGDGLEDRAEVYFESPDISVIMGLAVTPPDYPLGEGVFIASRNQVLLLLDRDRDDRADQVVTVAEGWPPPISAGGGVSDSLGLAIAPDGSVVFGLATDNFTNAYLLNPRTGKAGYSLASPRGTIQQVSPDFKNRSNLVTGIRVPVGLAFNRDGDLFTTDQEGATWLSNGNPSDELLHLQPGRHYGFPPVHPRHLPSVVDEPSLFDYGPQHQSTVGLWFNEPLRPNGAAFGPTWWRGDALVAAMSRGKIYRTKLARSAAGYVATNETFAQLQRIIIDQAINPAGALTVTLHSGRPDWGTGPMGMGELWQIAAQSELPPQPVATWSSSPKELRVTFDRPLSAAVLPALQGKVQVAQGRYAQAGDRFETMRPGYQIIKNQLAAPRFAVPVVSLALADDGHTLVLGTAERTATSTYAISLAADPFGVGRDAPYGGQIDLQAQLTGLEASWASTDGSASASLWLPHAEFAVAREFTAASVPHQRFFAQLARAGTISLRGQLDLGLMLYPEIQEGSRIDWEYPPETVTVTLDAARPFRSTVGAETITASATEARYVSRHVVVSRRGTRATLGITFDAGEGDADLRVSWKTDRSDVERPFPVRRFLLPYAREGEEPPMPGNADLPQLAGGNWLAGRTLFQMFCASCHAFNGEGPRVGPDLANLVYRDYESVLRDIRDPNAAINPEHVAYAITRKDGTELVSVLLTETAEKIVLAQVGGGTEEIARSEIATLKPLTTSFMPPGLDQAIGEENTRDLMRFLLVPGLEPAPVVLPDPPAPRSQAEFEPALQAIPAPPEDAPLKPLRIVLCAAEKDAGHLRPGLHDYPLWRERWSRLLGFAPNVTIETADRWPSAEQWARADIVVAFHNNPAWNASKAGDLDAFLARGGGLVFLHYSINAAQDRPVLAQRLGLAWGERGNKYRIGSTPLRFLPHEITTEFPTDRPVAFTDETYALMVGDLTGWTVLANSDELGGPAPQVWVRESGLGRTVVCIPGHSTWTHDDPLYRLLVFRAMLWSAREPLGRFNALTTVGARFAP